MGATFKEKAVSGVKWSALGQFGTQGVIILSSIVLARLLSPTEFGLMAMLTVLVGFASYFSNFGFVTALIQQKEVSEHDLSSVFWVNTALGVGLTIIFILLAPFIANFYDEPFLKPLTIAISVNFALNALTGVHIAILTRRLDFKKLSISTFCSIAISYSVAIFCAYVGFGVWSLVVQSVVNTISLTIFYVFFCRWRPQVLISKSSLAKLSKVGSHIFFVSLFEYIAANIDTVLIGKYIHKKQLGEYGRANAFTMLPVSNVSSVLARVLMPALSQIQDDKERVASIYFRTARILGLIIFPMMIGLALVAGPFVEVVFGSKWLGMVPMLQWFAPLGILASFNSIHDPIIVSQGRSDLLLKLAPFEKGIMIAAVFGGLYWGVFGIIICKAIAGLIITIPKFWILSKSIEVKMKQLFVNLLPSILSTGGMGVVIWLFQLNVYNSFPSYVLLISSVAVGVFSYSLITYFFNNSVLLDLKGVLKK